MGDIILVIDMQQGFTDYGKWTTATLTSKIAGLLERGIFDGVIASKFVNGKNSVYERLMSWSGLETEEEREIPPEILRHADAVIEKRGYSFVSADLIQCICQLNGGPYPERVFLAGVDTDCCVLSTAVSLFERNIRPIVLTRYVDLNGGRESHKAGLQCLRRLIGDRQLSDAEPRTKEELKEI